MRIIGGRAGGRTLRAPKGDGTRPTSDKVREAIFNILDSNFELPERVLDLYAGSGGLGLEALSRGVTSALFVDADEDACEVIQANAATLSCTGAVVVCSPVVRWLAKQSGADFGWVFLDPPYDSHKTGELDKALGLVAKKAIVAPGGLVIAEHEWRNAPKDTISDKGDGAGGLALFDRRRYGQTAVSFYRRSEEGNG
jgi:16S rRNA (guanine966-N2)-methyltransferase